MPDKRFLETYPLYRKYKVEYNSHLHLVERPAIHMECPVCESAQTFRMDNSYTENTVSGAKAPGRIVRAVYKCTACTEYKRYFFLHFLAEPSAIEKVGQWPSWNIAMDSDLAGMLGEHGSLYQQALVCESQSYGIGAFAYYRRMVEEVIDELLQEIGELIPDEDAERYAAALAQTRQTKVAAEKIALVKDMLPGSLRPGGINPLSVLHEVLSEGLHAGTDEDCMEWAAEVRESLVFLVGQVRQSKAGRKRFTKHMRKFLDRGSAADSQDRGT